MKGRYGRMSYSSNLSSVEEIRQKIATAKNAQAIYSEYSQEQANYIIKKVAEAAYKKSEYLARLAVEETGMGVIEHKKMKNDLTSQTLYESIKDEKTIGIIKENHEKKIAEIASPFGVVACIIPTTNPTSTAIFKTMIALKTLNAIVVSPHPSAVKCTIEALKICNQAAVKAGAPEGLINWIDNPTLDATTELMHHDDVDLILATGGAQLVRAAYSSGKPAYGVGPGNVPVYIEKSADVKKAVKRIVDSKTFDNGTICSTEQAVVVDANIKQMSMREFKNNGAYFLNKEEKAKIENVISPTRGKLNPKIVGRSAKVIAEMAGITIPIGTRLLMAEESRIAKDVPLSIEKLSPILPIYTAYNKEEAKRICLEILENGGKGHTMSLHTNDEQVMKEFGIAMPVSRIMVNTLSSIGAAGATSGLMPSMTLGCGSYGGNITSDNITARHLINIKRVALGIREVEIPRPSISHQNSSSTFINSYQTEAVSPVTHGAEMDAVVKQIIENLNKSGKAVDESMVTSIVENMVNQGNINSQQQEKPSVSNSVPTSMLENTNIEDKVKVSLETLNNSYNPEMITNMVKEIVGSAGHR